VFVACVFGIVFVFGLFLLILKYLEDRRRLLATDASNSRMLPGDVAVSVFPMPASLHGNSEEKQWREKLAELLQQIRLPLVTSRQLQLDHELAAA